jgi:hypothetical protein
MVSRQTYHCGKSVPPPQGIGLTNCHASSILSCEFPIFLSLHPPIETNDEGVGPLIVQEKHGFVKMWASFGTPEEITLNCIWIQHVLSRVVLTTSYITTHVTTPHHGVKIKVF